MAHQYGGLPYHQDPHPREAPLTHHHPYTWSYTSSNQPRAGWQPDPAQHDANSAPYDYQHASGVSNIRTTGPGDYDPLPTTNEDDPNIEGPKIEDPATQASKPQT